jgi:hypothetical protein
MKLLWMMALTGAALAAMPNLAVANHRHLSRNTNASVQSSPPACASPDAVCSAGTYVGSNPDPRARAQMLMDFNRGVYGMGNR